MLTVKITFKDGSEDVKDCWNLEEVQSLQVKEIKIIRDERKTK